MPAAARRSCRRVTGRMGRQTGRPADEPDRLPPGQGERAGAAAPEHHLRLRPAARPGTAKAGQPPAKTPEKADARESGDGAQARRRRFRSGGGGARPRLGLCLAPYGEIQPDRADRWTRRRHRPHAQRRADATRRRRMGHHQRLGVGHQPGDRLPARPIRPSTPSGSPSPAPRGWARPSSGPPRRTSAWRPCSRSSPARWARR